MALSAVQKQFPIDKLTATVFNSIYLCFICFLCFLFLFKLKRRSKSNMPPSPPNLPIIGNLHQLGTLPHRSLGALSRKYGPLMLFKFGQTPVLVVSSADVAREMMKTHDMIFANRPQPSAAKILLYKCMDVGFAPYGEYWRKSRKICVVEFLSPKRVRSFHFIREEEVAELVNNIREAYIMNGRSVNLSQLLITTSNNIVSRCVLGQKYNIEYKNSTFRELPIKVMAQIIAICVSDIYPCLRWIGSLIGLIPKLKATFEPIDAFLDEVIAQHKTVRRDAEHSDKNDFVDILLQLQEGGMLDFDLTYDNVKAIIMDMLVGGTETTSTTLEWAVAELIKNPITMEKAQEEVRRVIGCKPKVDQNDVDEMNYMKCVVKETLRLHPPAPLVPRETISNGKLGRYDIPAKTIVFVNTWAIQRDSEFWDRPEQFIPERFENSQIDFEGKDFQFVPFGAGRRGCPGTSFGIASVEYVLANLLYWFDWKLPRNGASVQKLDMDEVFGVTVAKKVPLHLEPIPYS